MQIVEVLTAQYKKHFLLLPLKLYKDDPNWVRPLDKDVEAVFDPAQNKFFRDGTCVRFLLLDVNENIIGRIAVFTSTKIFKKESQPTGGIGFFECINDQSAANKMFDHCKSWLLEKGIEAMDGPVNFGERESWWGLIVKGFTPVPYKMNYNPPYYQTLFENYGFQTYFEQWCYSLIVANRLDEKFYERHVEIEKNPDYKAVYLRKKELAKFAEDFRIVYNKAWAKRGEGKELEAKQVQLFFNKMKPVIDEKVIWFVYYKNEPVAMWINLPDINQIFGKFNGRFGLIEKLRFVWMLRKRISDKFIGLVFGVVPEHQGKGVDSFMIVEGAKVIQTGKLYKDYEMQWIGDFNPKMVTIAENLGTQKSRILKTYRYLFDRTKPFERHRIL
ncbi:MAG: hypothetical protein ABI763_00370 [Bacteroidota bacterium]